MEPIHLKLTKTHGKSASSIPIGYWVKGWGFWPECGKRVELAHPISTSLDEYFTWFHTTEVVSIAQGHNDRTFTTQNSTWKAEEIKHGSD